MGTLLNVLFVVTTSIQFVAQQCNIGNIPIDECLAMIGFSRNILPIYLIQKGNSANKWIVADKRNTWPSFCFIIQLYQDIRGLMAHLPILILIGGIDLLKSLIKDYIACKNVIKLYR